MSRIREHNLQEIAACLCCNDISLIALQKELRHKTAMVNVSMGQQHLVNIGRCEAKRLAVFIPQGSSALKHTAVNKDFRVLRLQQVAGARDGMGCSEEFDFHILSPYSSPIIFTSGSRWTP